MMAFFEGWKWVLWLMLACVSAWVALVLAFTAVMRAKTVIDEGHEFHWVFMIPYRIGFAIGVVLDVAWNFIVGTIAFREWPKIPDEWLFTSRCKRHKKKGPENWRGARALWWCEQLEAIHAGHC
jgi:hypothetical protein